MNGRVGQGLAILTPVSAEHLARGVVIETKCNDFNADR